MPSLTTAIPQMTSDAPEGSEGSADDAFVTERSFVKFSTQYLSSNKKIISNNQKIERVRERIDMMLARRKRRMSSGAPTKVQDEEEQEEEEKSRDRKSVV